MILFIVIDGKKISFCTKKWHRIAASTAQPSTSTSATTQRNQNQRLQSDNYNANSNSDVLNPLVNENDHNITNQIDELDTNDNQTQPPVIQNSTKIPRSTSNRLPIGYNLTPLTTEERAAIVSAESNLPIPIIVTNLPGMYQMS